MLMISPALHHTMLYHDIMIVVIMIHFVLVRREDRAVEIKVWCCDRGHAHYVLFGICQCAGEGFCAMSLLLLNLINYYYYYY